MNNQEILAGPPDGATHYSAKQKQYWDWPKRTVKPFDSGHLDIDYPDDLRSLADIARIVELEKERAALFHLCDSALEQAFDGCSFDGGDIQEQASDLGIITLTTFDPEKHENPSGELEEGDSYYEYAPWFLQIAKQLREGVKP